MYDCGVLHFVSSSFIRYNTYSCSFAHTHDMCIHTSFILHYVSTISCCIFLLLILLFLPLFFLSFNLPRTTLQGFQLCRSFFTSSTSSMKDMYFIYKETNVLAHALTNLYILHKIHQQQCARYRTEIF